MSSVFEKNEEQKKFHTNLNTYSDFLVGCPVRVICICQDFHFFQGTETGKVIKNSGKYLGIEVEFDFPIKYENSHDMKSFNFAPDDLVKIGGNMEIHERLKTLGLTRLANSFINKKEIKNKMRIAYSKYPHVTQEKIDSFNTKLAKKRLVVRFYRAEEYENGIPPEDVLVALEAAKKEGCFDYFEIAKVEELRDPILFGRISGCPDRFFLAQWGDDVKIEDILMEDDENVKATEPCHKKE